MNSGSRPLIGIRSGSIDGPIKLADIARFLRTVSAVSLVQLFIPNPMQEQIVKAIMVAHGVRAQSWRPKSAAELTARPEGARLIADIAALTGLGYFSAPRSAKAESGLIVLASRTAPVHSLHRRYGAELGARLTLPAFSLHPGTTALKTYSERLVNALGIEFDARRTRQFISGLSGARHSGELVDDSYRAMAWFIAEQYDWRALLQWLCNDDPLGHADRSWRMSRYSDCFVAGEAVGKLADYLGVDRVQATRVGQQLARLGLFRHVLGSAEFDDAELYFRLVWPNPRLAQLRFGALIGRLIDEPSGVFGSRAGKAAGPIGGALVTEALQRNCSVTMRDALTIGQTLVDVGVLRGVNGDAEYSDRDQYLPALHGEPETALA